MSTSEESHGKPSFWPPTIGLSLPKHRKGEEKEGAVREPAGIWSSQMASSLRFSQLEDKLAGPGSFRPPKDNKLGSLRRSKEDQDILQTKMTDQNFNIKKYPDPLVPRPPSGPESFPPGVTPEMEQRWAAMIRAAEEKRDAEAAQTK